MYDISFISNTPKAYVTPPMQQFLFHGQDLRSLFMSNAGYATTGGLLYVATDIRTWCKAKRGNSRVQPKRFLYHGIFPPFFRPSSVNPWGCCVAWQPCFPILSFSERRPVALRPTLSTWFAFFRYLKERCFAFFNVFCEIIREMISNL